MTIYLRLIAVLALSAFVFVESTTPLSPIETRRELADEALQLISENAPPSFTDDVILVLSTTNPPSSLDPSLSHQMNPLQRETIPKSGFHSYLASHPKTSVVFFDVSTVGKNASMEIATTYYAKSVLSNARRVKVLLVFNYNLMTSENRTYFATFLDEVSNLIKNWSKYRQGVALIASHCKTSGYSARYSAVRLIGKYLQEMKKNATSNRLSLIDAIWMSRDPAGVFNHIGHFNKFDSEAQGVAEVVQDVNFVLKSSHDFAFRLSPAAKSLLQLLNQRVLQRLASSYSKLSAEIQQHYQNFNSTTLTLTIGKIMKEYKSLTSLISSLEKIQLRKNFTQVLSNGLTNTMKVKVDPELLKSIKNDSPLLDFFDLFTSKSGPTIPVEWLRPLSAAAEGVLGRILKLGEALNTQMESTMVNASRQMTRAYQYKLSHSTYSPSGDERLLQEIHRDYERLNEMKIFIPSAVTFNDFITTVSSTVKKLTIRNHELPFLTYPIFTQTEDFHLNFIQGKFLAFNTQTWIRPIDQLLTFLNIEENVLEDRLRKWKQDEVLDAIRVSMQERCDRAIAEIRANLSSTCTSCA